MKEELQQQLYAEYPALFVNKNKEPIESAMAFGIECGDGWYDLIKGMCYLIRQREKNIANNLQYCEENNLPTPELELSYANVAFDQVKEKWGGLRIYYSGGDAFVSGVISMTEQMSYKICEYCGNKGQPNKEGWIVTLCDTCRKERTQ